MVGVAPDQALSQCDAYLRGMKGVAREAVSDTAGAAQAIAAGELRCVHLSSLFILRLLLRTECCPHHSDHRV
jgi:hypothetical protein